ncbi:MAG: hypothetical protein ACI4TT_01620 [Christensenellales bacterium]
MEKIVATRREKSNDIKKQNLFDKSRLNKKENCLNKKENCSRQKLYLNSNQKADCLNKKDDCLKQNENCQGKNNGAIKGENCKGKNDCSNKNDNCLNKDENKTFKNKSNNKLLNKFCLKLKNLFCFNKSKERQSKNDNQTLKRDEQKQNNDKTKQRCDRPKQECGKRNQNRDNSTKKGDKKESVKLLFYKNLLKKHAKTIIFMLILLVLFAVLTGVAFVKNPYYDFINRPKVLKSSSVLIILLLICCVLCVAEFVVNLLFLEKQTSSGNEKQNGTRKKSCKVKKIICNLKLLNCQQKHVQFKLLKTSKRKKQNRYSYKKNKKSKKSTDKYDILKYNCFVVLLFDVLCLSFKIKLLWACVFAVFFVCAINIKLLINNKNKTNRILNIVMLLANISIFLSFYLLYLLN